MYSPFILSGCAINQKQTKMEPLISLVSITLILRAVMWTGYERRYAVKSIVPVKS